MILAILFGIILGIFSGLIPGIHPNTISPIIAKQNIPFQTKIISILTTIIFYNSINTITTTFLGITNEETALAAQPAHNFVKKKRGLDAIRYYLIGQLTCGIIFTAITAILIPLIPTAYKTIQPYLAHTLIITLIFIILRHNQKKWTIITTTLAGILGYITLNSTLNEPLMHLFTGLYGISTLISNNNTQIPKQHQNTIINLPKLDAIKGTLGGIIGSTITLFPTLGPSHGALIARTLLLNLTPTAYLITIGGLSTTNILASVITASTIEKARNGPIAIINEQITINQYTIFTILGICMLSLGIATIITIKLAKNIFPLISRINYRKLSAIVIIFIFTISTLFDGITGIITLITASSIGIIAIKTNACKSSLMACIIIPVIIRLSVF